MKKRATQLQNDFMEKVKSNQVEEIKRTNKHQTPDDGREVDSLL